MPADRGQSGGTRFRESISASYVAQPLAIEMITLLALLSWTVLVATTPGRQPDAAAGGRASHCDRGSRAAL
jgi:hypothetical protein